MRILCLDIGEKRIGVAVSDELGITAQPVEVIQSKSPEQNIERIGKLCEIYETDRILCGLPLNMDGSLGKQAGFSRALGDALLCRGFDVLYQDERLTTVQARNVLLEADMRRTRRKQYIDKVAATFILQTFLDSGGWPQKKIKFIGGEYHVKDYEMDNREEQENLDDNIVELVDEEGQSIAFEHIMTFEHNDRIYICLVPVDPIEDFEEDELVIMRIEEDEEGNDVYSTIDDDTELQAAYEKYLELAEADE